LDSQDLRPRATDLVVEHSKLFRYALAADLGVMLINVKHFEIPDFFPVRTFNMQAGAGFHDSRVGLIPFTISTASLDAIQIAQVSPFAAKLPVGDGNQVNVPVWTPEGVELRQSGSQATFDIPVLQNVEWTGQLVGVGLVEVGRGFVTLRQNGDGTAVWRNFRIVPKGF